MATSTPALLQTIYTAYREKRLADVLALLTDDFQFTLHLPAESLPGAGAPHGKADTAKLLEGLIATYDSSCTSRARSWSPATRRPCACASATATRPRAK
jgi:ketosteroid isomerase-like protein